MDFRNLAIDGPIEISPTKHRDHRGHFSEIFRADLFAHNVTSVPFIQENQSLSFSAGTIRGIHFQSHPAAQGKLVRCLAGSVFDVAVDLRRGSASFGKWISVTLSPQDNNQLWIPVGFGHAFCTLEPNSVISYKVTDYYSRENDKGIAWDDGEIAIDWPAIADPATLSEKDRNQPRLVDLPSYFSMKDY
jgi:dTDP-4-dehydrorhamnose 3,5-epimerase